MSFFQDYYKSKGDSVPECSCRLCDILRPVKKRRRKKTKKKVKKSVHPLLRFKI